MPRIFIVRVFERDSEADDPRGRLIETLDFPSREALAIFFENGATMDDRRLYQVTSA